MNTTTLPQRRRAASCAAKPIAPVITSARDYLEAANAAFESGDLRKAREGLRAALAFQPEDADLLLALGHVEFGLGQYALALERYNVVCEMNEASARARSSKALTLQILQRSAEARSAAEEALALDPDDRVALKVLARISIDTGCHDKARGLCRRLLNLNPMDPEAMQFLDQCRFDLEAFLGDRDMDAAPGTGPSHEDRVWVSSMASGRSQYEGKSVLLLFPQ